MKKVLVICNYLPGLMSFRKEILERLFDNDYKVVVVAPYDDLSSDIEKMGCDFVSVEMDLRGTNPISDLKLMRSYRKILKVEKPDIVLTYTIKPNVYAGYICRKLAIPYIATITGLGTSVEEPGLLQKITVHLYKMGLKKAKCVFFQNQDNLEFMLGKKIIKGKYRLVSGSGVNLEHHTMLPYPKDETIRFLFISRIIFEKGIEDYLNTAIYIKKKNPHVEFHILGRCDDEKYLERINQLEKKKVVFYHGQVSDIRKFQEISNCTIHPSFYPEGMSNVLLETCAAGRPIITTNRAGCKEIVEDGVNGYMIECRDLKMLKKKVEEFVNLPYSRRRQMGLNARKKVEKDFDRKKVIDAYIEEIEEKK